MHEATKKRLLKLQSKVQKERDDLHYKIFVESHPNLVEGDHEKNREEIARYFEFQKSGFDTSEAIEEMVKLDGVISDLESMLWRYKEELNLNK